MCTITCPYREPGGSYDTITYMWWFNFSANKIRIRLIFVIGILCRPFTITLKISVQYTSLCRVVCWWGQVTYEFTFPWHQLGCFTEVRLAFVLSEPVHMETTPGFDRGVWLLMLPHPPSLPPSQGVPCSTLSCETCQTHTVVSHRVGNPMWKTTKVKPRSNISLS